MKKSLFSLPLLSFLFISSAINAQVTIGSGNPPKHFSILEIDAIDTKGGLRFPQIFDFERDTISVMGNTSSAPGLTIYNKTDHVLEYWNGTNWTRASETEPWQVSGLNTKATLNTQHIYQMGRIGVGINTPSNQLHVWALNNPLRVQGLVSGIRADSLVTIDGTGVVRQRSVYELRKDVVAPPVPVNQVFAGMIKYDTTTKTLQYYDGTTWQIVASNTYNGKNEGVVRVVSGNLGTQPTFVFSSPASLGVFQPIKYTTPLSLVAYWPENIASPTDANIILNDVSGNTTFVENPIIGQVHIWRVIGTYSGKSSGTTGNIAIRLTNSISGFTLQQSASCAAQATSGVFTMNFITIADGASLPPAGKGYALSITGDVKLDVTINSITRVSNYKD